MRHGNPKVALALLAPALGLGMVLTADAADTGITPTAPSPFGTSRTAPAQPAAPARTQVAPAAPVAPVTPVTPVTPAKAPSAFGSAVPATAPSSAQRGGRPAAEAQRNPDYAVVLNSQQEFNNRAMAWTFRIENRGNAAPEGEKETIKMPGGSFPYTSKLAAKLVISVGQPCPGTKSWKQLEVLGVPVVQPGASAVVPSTLYKMPDEYAAKGCRFKAELQGPAGDANPSNNGMQMITKLAMLPDLIIGWAEVSGGPGGAIEVRNIGNAPAGPSKFHYECQSSDKTKSCGLPSQEWKGSDVRDVAIPALDPGKAHLGKGSTPNGVAWKATADYANEVQESNESNNTRTSTK